MSDFLTLSCPICTGQLQITEDLERFACAYCGTEHIVRRTPGTVSLQPLVQGIQNVQKGVDRTASELAIVRLEREIPDWIDRLETILDERKSLEAESSEEERKARLVILLIIAGILILALAAMANSGSGAFVAILLIALSIGLIGKAKQEQPSRMARIAEIKTFEAQVSAELETRQRQLAHHRKEVSG